MKTRTLPLFAATVTVTVLASLWGSATVAAHSHKHAASPPRASAPASNDVQVWVNTKTSVYHMPGSRWYANTAQGKYLPEKAAIAEGDRRSERG